MAKKPATKKSAARKLKASATPPRSSDKDHLVSLIQAGTGASKKASGETLKALTDSISMSLKKNGKVQLIGFGSFDVTKRKARMGVNPATGEKIRIKASKGVRFKPGAALKGRL